MVREKQQQQQQKRRAAEKERNPRTVHVLPTAAATTEAPATKPTVHQQSERKTFLTLSLSHYLSMSFSQTKRHRLAVIFRF